MKNGMKKILAGVFAAAFVFTAAAPAAQQLGLTVPMSVSAEETEEKPWYTKLGYSLIVTEGEYDLDDLEKKVKYVYGDLVFEHILELRWCKLLLCIAESN